MEDDPAVDRLQLLAVTKTRGLFLYEVTLEFGKWDAALLRSCPEDRLMGLIASKNASLPSISSLKVLSFKNGRVLLLLNNFMIAHLVFPGGELDEEVEDCFRLDLPPQTLERIADVTFCRGVLFLLDETGWIRIL